MSKESAKVGRERDLFVDEEEEEDGHLLRCRNGCLYLAHTFFPPPLPFFPTRTIVTRTPAHPHTLTHPHTHPHTYTLTHTHTHIPHSHRHGRFLQWRQTGCSPTGEKSGRMTSSTMRCPRRPSKTKRTFAIDGRLSWCPRPSRFGFDVR